MSALGAAISGLQTSQKWLDVISNNVSNSQTVAYKGGRANFSDLISDGLRSASGPDAASNLGGINPSSLGLGVTVASIQVLQKQGATQVTGNVTDISIQGQGFLTVRKGADTLYTRAGNLTFDNKGNLVTNDGGLVQGWQFSYQRNPAAPGPMLQVVGQLNTTNTAAIGNIQIPNNLTIAPLATSDSIAETNKDRGIIMSGNLDNNTPINIAPLPKAALATAAQVAVFTPDAVTSFTAYDSKGTAYPMTMYWQQTNATPGLPANWEWTMWYTPAGSVPTGGLVFPAPGAEVAAIGANLTAGAPVSPNNPPNAAGFVTFNPDGSLATNGGTTATMNPEVAITLTNGAISPFIFTMNFGTPNLAGPPATYGLRDGLTGDYGNGTFNPLTGIYQPIQTAHTERSDGYSDGQLTGLSFNTTGGVDASFSNGQTVTVAKVAMTKFANTEGLARVGSNYFAKTVNSGQGQVGTAGSSGFGAIQGSALESSNVDLTVELTNMILAQRMFESNARVVTSADKILDTLVNLGR